MPRHSQNNTSRGYFTSGERAMLAGRYGTKSARLGADSMRRFNQCALCLDEAHLPVSCLQGHLTCRECALTSALEQTAAIERTRDELARLERQQEEERERAREDARRKVLRDFERQTALGGRSQAGSGLARRRSRSPSPRAAVASGSGSSSSALVTREESGISSLPARIAAAAAAASDAAEAELLEQQAAEKRARFPAYWLPSLTPTARSGELEELKKEAAKMTKPRCLVGSEHGHESSIKALVDVKFSPDPTDGKPTCPSCRKAITNSSTLNVLRRCGHVYCTSCTTTLLGKRSGAGAEKAACLECSKAIKDASKDVIALQREGTGHVGAGNVEVKKAGVAFQG